MKSRLAIIDSDKCKAKKCKQECLKSCPVVRMGKQCIEIENIAKISETLCTGCGQCVKKCPFNAIKIINLPSQMGLVVHRYGPNSFQLHRLPILHRGSVLGIIGENGLGKSTLLKILSGKLIPNFNSNINKWESVPSYFKGSQIQNYFNELIEGKLKISTKPQYVDAIRKITGKVGDKLNNQSLINKLKLNHLLDRDISKLSGGELQRFAIAITLQKKADVYLFDEPSSFLDIKQRLIISELISNVKDSYALLIEHDLAILDYISDNISIVFGEPGAYGVVTSPLSTKRGINSYLDGYIPSENMKFREPLTFHIPEPDEIEHLSHYEYPNGEKRFDQFHLKINPGKFMDSQITVILGENGMGKTTFLKMLREELNISVSYKPQILNPKFQGTVRDLLQNKIGNFYLNPQFKSEVMKPLDIDRIIDTQVQVLSGGELQRVALVLSLGKKADVYLIDEPSAYLDVEQRYKCVRVIRRWILSQKKSAFLVEHDFMMAVHLADQVIVFQGEPGKETEALSPTSIQSGMNLFLKSLNVTLRKDDRRYRINKLNSVKDLEQKRNGKYFE